MQKPLIKKGIAVAVIVLLIGISVIPIISGSIETINKVVYEDVSYDRIEDMYGLKYDERGYIINNQLVRKDANLVNIKSNGPGEINPMWINLNYDYLLRYIEIYEDHIYAACWNWDVEEEKYYMTICKYESSDGSLIWMKNWSSPNHPDTVAHSLNVYNDAIYVVGFVGPFQGIIWWMDSYIRKYDLDGNLLWSRIINETTFDKIHDVKVYDNYLYLCGAKDRTSWILKYDTNGNKIWGKTHKILGTWLSDFYDLEIYNDNIYAGGQTNSHDNTRQDVFVAKVSLDGKLIWKREWGGIGSQIGHMIDVYNDNIYVCGSGAEYPMPFRDLLLKYNLDGELQWYTTSLCPPSGFHDVIAYNGSIYTGGEFYRFEYDWDAVLYKFDEDSKLIWYLTYGPYDYYDIDCLEIYEDYIYIGGYGGGGGGFLMKYDLTLFSDNNKPDTPAKPSGPTSGIPGEEYTYSTNTTDSDGDLLSYDFLWGVWNVTTVEWFDSGETVSASHSWDERGKYNIKVRSRDECGFVSDWSEPLEVTMPKNKASNFNLNLLGWLFERFPMLERLLGILGWNIE
ncbi:MAG: hypothetical protein JSW60_08525, partial [Thermoplasmatales archaeon]